MNLNTRFFLIIRQIILKIKTKLFIYNTNFSIGIFLLFFGFLLGNLFGSFLTIVRELFIWDGFIILLIIFLIELINYFNYRSKKRIFLFTGKKNLVKKNVFSNKINWNLWHYINKFFLFNFFSNKLSNLKNVSSNEKKIQNKTIYSVSNLSKAEIMGEKRIFVKNINFLKIGVMLGFFIDAFKVGS